MPLTFDTLPALLAHGFDTLIDVRSPAEYAEDHIPGAVSMPALTNEERAIVGTIYVQDSPFRARKIGAAMVARNAADHIDGLMADCEGGWRPLVYCWRGGQRSGSFASILAQIGWRTDTIQGGYRTYRRLVVQALHETPIPHRIVLLDGNTGTAKTELLQRLAARGVQVLDLEGMANHRGSLFGGMGAQPSQKWFETQIVQALMAADPGTVTVVEAESSKVGDLLVPPSLWTAMCAAPRIRIEAPLEARADYLTRAYADVVEDEAQLNQRLASLSRIVPAELLEDWRGLAQRGEYRALAAGLMEHHYDPRYRRQRARHEDGVLGVVDAPSLAEAALDELAARIEALLPA